MATAKIVSVKVAELVDALDFVSAGEWNESCAYISLDTGKIYWMSELIEQELPDDIEISDRYVSIPHKRDLNLGRSLALSFTERELPDDCATVTGFFRRRGAYRHFKNLLESREMLERWYEAEQQATVEALRSWCDEFGVKLDGG